jgi:hypothetical protein
VRGPTAEFELDPVPAVRGGLIISEYHFMSFFRLGIGQYSTGGFLELYNNSDSTIHLDGKLVGRTFDPVSAHTAPCDWTAPFRTDPGGIWAREIQRFPGSGQDYPVHPGETVVIATDAIDHREFIDELLDLSQADFEFSGPSGPDNPGVPNMIDVGPSSSGLGHGIIFASFQGIPFLAGALDVEVLPMARFEPWTFDMPRIPREHLVDVAAFHLPAHEFPGLTWCHPFVHTDFLREAGPHIPREEGWLVSINRKVLFELPDGQLVLQHTRNSAADFYLGERTPGWIP